MVVEGKVGEERLEGATRSPGNVEMNYVHAKKI
jgi:hypothetical protein